MAIEECVRAAEATCTQNNNKGKPSDTADTLNNLISQVFERCENAVFGVDAHGRIGYWNPQCASLLGLPEGANIRGQHSSDLLCGGDRRCTDDGCSTCPVHANMQREEQINDFILTLCTADGSELEVTISTCYFYQDDAREISTYFTLGIPGATGAVP